MPLSSLTSAALGALLSTLFGSPVELAEPSQEIVVPSVGRSFPAGVRLGLLKASPANERAIINDRAFLTAPGLQIRNEANRIILPTMLTGANFTVLYKMDATESSVWRIWILTPAEIASIKAGIQVVAQQPVEEEQTTESETATDTDSETSTTE
ncbi:MAG: hypothetical protein LBJ59_02130 [Zoogloeaceae bacterium]|jgi:hypothetical protein|nr:hypothetical protein [Zoogloeaceae bacterium]